MLRFVSAYICCLVLGIVSCKASFQDIQKKAHVSSGDGQGAKDDAGKPKPADPDDYPILENKKLLSPEESKANGCNGIMIVYEKGKDKNRDNILQASEVTDIRTECQPSIPGKEPPCPNQNTNQNTNQSANQSKDPNSKCPDNPKQSDPSQSGKK